MRTSALSSTHGVIKGIRASEMVQKRSIPFKHVLPHSSGGQVGCAFDNAHVRCSNNVAIGQSSNRRKPIVVQLAATPKLAQPYVALGYTKVYNQCSWFASLVK